MTQLKGTQTAVNLMKAFAGESQARNRYTYFSSQAKKEGFEQIAAIFAETADQEKEHAKRLFKAMEGGDMEITASFPFGVVGTTEQNLLSAAAGEHHEYDEMYPEFAETARKEGFAEIANMFLAIAVAEKFHEERYLELARNIKEGLVFEKPADTEWRCRNCGYTLKGKKAPDKCPACAHPQAHFELLMRNW